MQSANRSKCVTCPWFTSSLARSSTPIKNLTAWFVCLVLEFFVPKPEVRVSKTDDRQQQLHPSIKQCPNSETNTCIISVLLLSHLLTITASVVFCNPLIVSSPYNQSSNSITHLRSLQSIAILLPLFLLINWNLYRMKSIETAESAASRSMGNTKQYLISNGTRNRAKSNGIRIASIAAFLVLMLATKQTFAQDVALGGGGDDVEQTVSGITLLHQSNGLTLNDGLLKISKNKIGDKCGINGSIDPRFFP